RCLHGVYEDRGWDITNDTNVRLDSESDAALAFPTLTDLLRKVEEMTWELGYDEEVTSNIDAALRTRINSLRTGGKGRMLDVQRSVPMQTLLEKPTVLELEGMGDDDDKAFVMGLFFVRLAEHRRAAGQADGLRHLLVIEEAHRLLSNVQQSNGLEEGDPRGKAVETFTNLLSEIRAYGQGVFVSDQVPVKLAPDVIKNTNLKIAHRVVDKIDREVLAGSMAMTESQTKGLGTLKRGQAAVFSEGDDAPLLVQVPKAKGQHEQSAPDNRRVAELMAAWRERHEFHGLFRSCASDSLACGEGGEACDVAREIVEGSQFQNIFARIVLSAIEDTGALDRMWEDLVSLVRAKRPPKLNEEELLNCLMMRSSQWFADRRGAQAGWTYAETARLADGLCRMLRSKAEKPDLVEEDATERTDFQQHAIALHTMEYAPFIACDQLCLRRQPPACPGRYAIADLMASDGLWEGWHEASVADSDSQDYRRTNGWLVCLDAADQLIEMSASEEARRHVALCFAQQMLSADEAMLPETKAMVIEELVSEAINSGT
ncbi:MAG: Putative ATP-binding protein, partial [uncultured Chloroflexia bacterium]